MSEEAAADPPPSPSRSDAEPPEPNELFRPIAWAKFGRQCLLGLAVLAALGGGWWAMQRQRLAVQNKLIAELESLGGEAILDTAFDSRGRLLPQDERSTGLLGQILGQDVFARVEGVRLKPGFDRDVGDLVVRFAELRYLSVAECRLEPGELAGLLSRLPQLERVDIRGVKLSAEEEAELKGLSLKKIWKD